MNCYDSTSNNSILQASAWLDVAHALLSAQRSEFIANVNFLFSRRHHSQCSAVFLRSYQDKKQYFDLQRTLSKGAKSAAAASAHNLLDNATRVCAMLTEDAYTCLLAQQYSRKITASVPDDVLCFTADSEGWLLQATHLLHTGLTMDQYLEFDCSIATVDMDRGGSTMMAGYGNLA